MENPIETSQFDSALGGTEQLPYSANNLRFAASRSVEIAAMTESIRRPSNVKLIFQSLPVHMRRRVMSHNAKRLPRKLQVAHFEQLKKSGLPPKQKRPSRKYRRRPANLLEEYTRRQKHKLWLETHIWHAKRFHMIERWGFRLPYAPCDKAFRACYRASSAHCLLQDISYYCPIQITGTIENIKHFFNNITHPSCGLGICSKAFINGTREGKIHLYSVGRFPYGYIGQINFIWISTEDEEKVLWLFVHPQHVSIIDVTFRDILDNNCIMTETPGKKRKLDNSLTGNIKIKMLPKCFNRFRLTGPNSHAILVSCLKCVDTVSKIKTDEWVSRLDVKKRDYLKEKSEYWQKISSLSSPSQLPPKVIVGLTVRDPRLSRPSKREKAKSNGTIIDTISLLSHTQDIAISPLWDLEICNSIKSKAMTNGQFIQHISKNQLVPGEVYLEDPKVQSVPIVLIQRPGSQDASYKKIGYGSGWDIIVPSGYGLPFWHTFIMFGGRAGGLRETESMALESGECYFSPDSEAGHKEEKRIESELRARYFSLPPSKRVNYTKLGINSPFICPWKILLTDWSNQNVEKFYVLRDRKHLETLQECLTRQKPIPQIDNINPDECLIPIHIQILGKGSLKRHALICMPRQGDFKNIKTLLEPHREDPNETLRKEKRTQHIKDLKKWRRKRIKNKKISNVSNNAPVKRTKEPSEYVKMMRELCLPSQINSVRNSTSREILGYLIQGAFSFTEACSCGLGYVTYNALSALLRTNQNKVLIRNTSSRKFRIAALRIILNNNKT